MNLVPYDFFINFFLYANDSLGSLSSQCLIIEIKGSLFNGSYNTLRNSLFGLRIGNLNRLTVHGIKAH